MIASKYILIWIQNQNENKLDGNKLWRGKIGLNGF